MQIVAQTMDYQIKNKGLFGTVVTFYKNDCKIAVKKIAFFKVTVESNFLA